MPSHKLRHILSSFLITHVNGIFNSYLHRETSISIVNNNIFNLLPNFQFHTNSQFSQLILHRSRSKNRKAGTATPDFPPESRPTNERRVHFLFLFPFFSWSLVNTNIGGAIKLRRKSGVLVALHPVIVAVFVDGPGRQYSSAPDTSTPDVIRSTTLLDFNFVRRPNYRVHAASCRSVA